MQESRLREKGGGEFPIPACEVRQQNGMSGHTLDVLLRGILSGSAVPPPEDQARGSGCDQGHGGPSWRG